MPYKIVKKDLDKIKADAIVNPANKKPVCTPGTPADTAKGHIGNDRKREQTV